MPHKSMLMNPPGLPSHGRREGKGKRGKANIHWDPGKICKADTCCWRILIYLAFSEIIILTRFAQELQYFEDWLAKLVLTGHTSCSPKPHRSVLVAVPTPPWDTLYPGVLFPSSTSKGGMSPPGIPACFPFCSWVNLSEATGGDSRTSDYDDYLPCALWAVPERGQVSRLVLTWVGSSQALITHSSGSNGTGNWSLLLPPPS